MNRLYNMAVGDDTHELAVFEVDGVLAESDLDLAANDGTTARARVSVQRALAQLRPVLSSVADLVAQAGPQEAEVEFGLKMGGETGVVIAKGTSEVNFSVRMSWKRSSAQ